MCLLPGVACQPPLLGFLMGPGLTLGSSPSRRVPHRVTSLRERDLRFFMAFEYPPRWLLKLDSMARVTCPGPSAVPRLGPSLASGQRPSDHAGPGGPGPAQPMG